ncbi:MAG: helix-hairpin-helix domain-containing protein [Clostridia bacterium]|nr:helix-hairpin-helix domain-containing protein [Clostridia bacterium]
MDNTENNKQKEAEEKKENYKISDKTAIRLLIGFIVVLLIYIIGQQAIDIIGTKLLEEITIQEETATSEELSEEIIKININSDNIYELTSLKGIGQSKAQAIIEYRKENGDFISVDELKNVPGIGDTLYEELKDFITVE